MFAHVPAIQSRHMQDVIIATKTTTRWQLIRSCVPVVEANIDAPLVNLLPGRSKAPSVFERMFHYCLVRPPVRVTAGIGGSRLRISY
jgi:hypothetical protein